MARSTIYIYNAIAWTQGNLSRMVGSVNIPTSQTGVNTVTGRSSSDTFTVAATGDANGADKILVWDGTAAGAIRDWSVLSVRVLGTGSLELEWMVDTPTSEANLVASGSNARILPDSVSNTAALMKDNTRIWMNATQTTTMGLTGGVPTLFTSAGNALFKRYKLWAWNRSSSAVDIEVSVFD